VLSSGNATLAAAGTNPTALASLALKTGTAVTDADMVAASAASGFSQTLFDGVMLTFDITPTASGPIYFRCRACSGIPCA
jgi:hypothetical protein